MSQIFYALFPSFLLWGMTVSSPVERNNHATVVIDSGVLVGESTSILGGELPINKYLGVPFAASPVRFEPPARPTP
jgi:hypothetical protein